MGSTTLVTVNFSRLSNGVRLLKVLEQLEKYNIDVFCGQEIDIFSAVKFFGQKYQVFVNWDVKGKSNIGICTLVKKELKVFEKIYSLNGRIIGIKLENMQIWNIYPPSGSEYRKERGTFFNEILVNYMSNWKDQTRFLIQAGDHNCTYRLQDSMNNSQQHIEKNLVKHLRIQGLKDDFVKVNGEQCIEYSRITGRSATRIDYVFSNVKSVKEFIYSQVEVEAGKFLDHKAGIVSYDIQLQREGIKIPKKRFFQSWVLQKDILHDEDFIGEVETIVKIAKEEIEEEESRSDEEPDISMYWNIVKEEIRKAARKKEKENILKENGQRNYLEDLYEFLLKKNGNERSIVEVKRKLDDVYRCKAQRILDKCKREVISNGDYDLFNMQKQRKFESESRFDEIRIKGKLHEGTVNIVDAIQEEMVEELHSYDDKNINDPPSDEEEKVLQCLPDFTWTKEEVEELNKPTTEEEVYKILKNETKLDSAPGEDGITSRALLKFWEFPAFRWIYIKYLNFTRFSEVRHNDPKVGIMIVKNKKSQSIEYEKKRKLTKINKDSNVGNGKVWTNRLKSVVLPKILPMTQFNCQEEVNILDEVREIKEVNNFLMNNGKNRTGTMLSIDFKDAFRSVSLRWFNLVMKKCNIPEQFREWFWKMYENLGVMIVVNSCKSDIIKVARGFMEGHPASMAGFVVSLIPLMIKMEGTLRGITTNKKNHKCKFFADDCKAFISDIEEIDDLLKLIEEFEGVSGVRMHRDPQKGKCQALPFGDHKQYKDWNRWPWVSVQNKVKIVGAIFCNDNDIDKLNSDLACQNFYYELQKYFGFRGTIFQKVSIVNTYLFSKIWYLSQAFQMNHKDLEKVTSRALNFIYAGENERPIRPLNFRKKGQGGVGLIHPRIKSEAFLIKGLGKSRIGQGNLIKEVPKEIRKDFEMIQREGILFEGVGEIYNRLLNKIIYKNMSLIPSRNERRVRGVRWRSTWRNLGIMQGLDPEEKCLAWKISQDMVDVGQRRHRAGAKKNCQRILDSGEECGQLETLQHCLLDCAQIQEQTRDLMQGLSSLMGCQVSVKQVLNLSIRHRKCSRLKVALWLIVKIFSKSFKADLMKKVSVWKEVLKDFQSLDRAQVRLGDEKDIEKMISVIMKYI